MPSITVNVVLDASPEDVWADIENIATHPEWMEDAVSIAFTSDQQSGAGTEFDCATAIGPFRLTDHMEITSWVPAKEMGVRHVGLITGTGVFQLSPIGPAESATQTSFEWTEKLNFPWWLGGPIGATVAKPVLRHVWRTNLQNLQKRYR
jgi:hypothetical protein